MIYFYQKDNLSNICQNAIIIYMGSFSPLTIGHLQVIINIATILPNNQLLVIPVNDLYCKAHLITGKNIENEYHRMSMCKLLISYIKDNYHINNVSCSDYAFKCNTINADQNVLDYYQSLYVDRDIYFLCGADTYMDIPNWKNNSLFTTKYHLIIHPRDNDISSTKLRKKFAETGKIENTIQTIQDYLIKYNLLSRLKQF
jgi:nicotinate (nicotinamide) nucleotide adenylyltransferase